MKKIILALSVFLMATNLFSQQFRRYNVATGKVTLEKETKKESIIKTIIFKDFGAIEYSVEVKKTYKGKKKKKLIKEITKITKLDNALVYSVDEKEKQIIQMKNYGLVLFKNKNLTDEGKRISKANRGREVDYETILGYNCEVWKLRGTTTVMYKGFPLKTISRGAEIATSAKFDVTITANDIALPNYPIINVNPWQDAEDTVEYLSTEEGQQEVLEGVSDALEQAKNMTWEDWYKLHGEDEQFVELSEEEITVLYNKEIQGRVDKRIDKRVNDRINQKIRQRSRPKKKIKIPRW